MACDVNGVSARLPVLLRWLPAKLSPTSSVCVGTEGPDGGSLKEMVFA